MRRMRRIGLLVLLALLLPIFSPIANATHARSSNVDLSIDEISITYPDSNNQSLYQMFSSNYPIPNFDKPQELYVTDGVVNVEMKMKVDIQNLGSSQSGFVDVFIVVLHNEYTRFELLNTSLGLNPISGSSTSSAEILWTPTYSGNHTLQISVSNSIGDDDLNNNQKSRHLTVAYHYDNCISMVGPGGWTGTGDWQTSNEAYISQNMAFHVGNGAFSSYQSNQISTLTSPVFNIVDSLKNHNSAIGYSFFYTGGMGSGDYMEGSLSNEFGQFGSTFNMTGVVDNDFMDGISWQTFSFAYNGKNSPLIPVNSDYFHTNTQLKWTFVTDSIGNDIGMWIDDIVIIYEQAARKSEYNIDISTLSNTGGLPDEWTSTQIEVVNSGNISARYTPSLTGIPENWLYYFANSNGASIGSSGIELMPGETRTVDLRVLVDQNATQGNIPISIEMTSNLYGDISDSLQVMIEVLPDRIPEIIIPEFTPRCPPGSTCQFPITVENIGEADDVFIIEISDKNVLEGWSIDLAFNQSTEIFVQIDTPVEIWFTASIPNGVEADTISSVWLTVTSTTNSQRLDIEAIEIAAAIVSNAEITVSEMYRGITEIEAGTSKDISFTIWNNASRLDIFQPQIDYTEITGWNVELLWTQELAINPDSSSTFSVRITAPSNAQSGDFGPMIQPKIISIRSGETIIGNGWQGLRVSAVYDISVSVIETPNKLSPGIPNLVTLEITNSGNGPDTAVFGLPWSPSTWEWWAFYEDENVTNGLDLSVSYDLENVKIINLWILLPSLEAPGEFHEITIEANPINGNDINDFDNRVVFEAATDIVKSPRLDGYPDEVIVRTGDTYRFNATAWNIGNAVDSNSRARVVMVTTPETDCVIGFLSTDDGRSTDANNWLNLNLGPTESVELIAELIIGDDCDLNTKIDLTIEFEGGEDELDRPLLKTLDSLVMVGERRSVIIEEIPSNFETENNTNIPHILWINVSSTSTQIETVDISVKVPEGWGMLCDGKALHLENIRVEMDEGHINEETYNLRCEVLRESGDYFGQLILEIVSIDGEFNFTINTKLDWKEPIDDAGVSFMTYAIYGGGSIVLIVLSILSIRILRKNNHDVFEKEIIEIDESDDEIIIMGTEKTEIVGPPASGPPASAFSQPADETIDPAMLEYQKQLEEYNRKMAEYQKWQDSQGSQQEP